LRKRASRQDAVAVVRDSFPGREVARPLSPAPRKVQLPRWCEADALAPAAPSPGLPVLQGDHGHQPGQAAVLTLSRGWSFRIMDMTGEDGR
jgi:hypothetical protein